MDFILLRDILLIENFIIILIIRLLVFHVSIILIIIIQFLLSRLGVNNSRGGYPAWDLIMNKLVGDSIPVLEVESAQLAIILAK